MFDLPTTMSKFLLLGDDAGRGGGEDDPWPRRGRSGAPRSWEPLQPGASADVLVFSVEAGEFRFQDSHLQERVGERRLRPELVVVRGRVVKPSEVPVRLRRMTPWDDETHAALRETAAAAGNY